MSNVVKAILIVSLLILVGIGGYLGNFLSKVSPFASGFTAHTLCSNIFIANRSFDDIHKHDLASIQQRLTRSRVEGNTIVTEFGVWPVSYTSKAVYREGLGCSQLAGGTHDDIIGPSSIERKLPSSIRPELRFPDLTVSENIDPVKLQQALDTAFAESAESYEDQKNTRGIVILHGGRLIAERYAKGFSASTPLNSWSMTKTATSALIGILVGDGDLNVKAPAPIPEWRDPSDNQSKVTTEDLLFMVSGLEFNEGYENDPISDVNKMLMNTRDITAFSASFPVTAEPGSRWAYQTASSMLLGKVIRQTIENDEEYFQFIQMRLFNQIGARDSYYQADSASIFSGGAFLWATPRDWARIGRMYLNDGIYEGKRILPEGWVKYSTTPTEASIKARAYGAQVWLNHPAAHDWLPELPEDTYAAQGHYGQYMVVIPSLDLVVVRMGQTFNSTAFDLQGFLLDVIKALPNET